MKSLLTIYIAQHCNQDALLNSVSVDKIHALNKRIDDTETSLMWI
jgi:hypothetical protein